MSCRTIILAIFVFAVIPCNGQSYDFRHYQVENGLSNNAVVCAIQDQKGFLWFGTKDGLNRFDGYSFKVFRNDPDISGSIGNNFIHCLYEDRNGVMWIGTENGLYHYNATTERFSLLDGTTPGNVRDIQMDAQGNLWFISAFLLYKYDVANKKLDVLNSDRRFEATSICTSRNGAVWISTPDGFLKNYHAPTNTFADYNLFSHSPKTVSNWIEKLYALDNNNILAGTSNQGAKLFDVNSHTYKDILTYNTDKTEIFARNFVQTAPDQCWIGTETGIFVYNMTTGATINLRTKYTDPYSISDNAVYTFCKDKEGGIWAGTYFGGVNYWPKQTLSFKKYFPRTGENSVSGHVVREIHQDRNGNLWIGTENAGLNKLDTATGMFTVYKPGDSRTSISYTNIHGLLVSGNDLWIGTFEHGLDVMDINTGKVKRHYAKGAGDYSLKSNFIYCIYESPDAEIMLGTTTGAYVYDRASDRFQPMPGMPLYNWYSSLLKDDHGVTWAGTYGNGVNYYDSKTKKSGNFRYAPNDKNSISSDRVNSLFLDSDKRLWFATEGGLCLLDRSTMTFKRYTTRNGFPTNFILCLLEDRKKNLWISTSKGLVCFNPATEKLNIYTKANGLLNDQFNFSSAFKDADGRMYFGSVKGLVSFHPEELTGTDYIPPVYITGFQVNNKELAIEDGSPLSKSITYTDKIVLTHRQSTFSIDFASLNYTAPEMSEYAYRVEGLDDDWTYLKTNRKVYFTQLSPGTYVFKVKASDNNGTWNEKETRLLIEILPPWWASKTAYVAYAVIIALLIYYAVHSYHRRVKEKNRRKIEQLELAKEKEIYEAKIEFFTNVAHEIKTPLTLIKGPLEKVIRKAGTQPEISDSLRIMEKNTSRLVDLSNQLLDFRQTEIKGFSLNFTEANILELVEETYLSFKPLAEQKDISFSLHLHPTRLYASIDIDAFNKILANLFSNALKYAQQEVRVTVPALNENDRFLTIEFRNDGYLIPFDMREKIFEPFFRLKATEKQKGTGIGLALSRSLTQLHKGILELRPSENNMNVFVIRLPLHQANDVKTMPANGTSFVSVINREG